MRYNAKYDKEKKRLVPDQNLVDTHPLKDKIEKAHFIHKLDGKGSDPIVKINLFMTALRTITSKTYSDVSNHYYNTGGICETEAELDAHLDWMFELIQKYGEDAKALLKAHRKERLEAQNANS